MFRYLQLFVIFAIVVGASVYLPLSTLVHKAKSSSFAHEAAKQVLLREAKLVEYFCLSSIPPTIGEVNMPKAWEKALNSTINLRSSAGEVSGLYTAFREYTNALTKLTEGQAVYAQSTDQHYLAYIPLESPNWFIVIAKPSAALDSVAATPEAGVAPLCIAAVLGIIGALILTGIARFILSGAVATKN